MSITFAEFETKNTKFKKNGLAICNKYEQKNLHFFVMLELNFLSEEKKMLNS